MLGPNRHKLIERTELVKFEQSIIFLIVVFLQQRFFFRPIEFLIERVIRNAAKRRRCDGLGDEESFGLPHGRRGRPVVHGDFPGDACLVHRHCK